MTYLVSTIIQRYLIRCSVNRKPVA